MAVFTHVSLKSAQDFLQQFPSLPPLQKITPITQGIENSNYILHTKDKKRYILTLFEHRVQENDVPYFASLMDFLSQQQLPVAQVIKNHQGKLHHLLKEKPCIITSFLSGTSTSQPLPLHTQQAGTFLAKLHLSSPLFPLHRQNTLSLPTWKKLISPCLSHTHSLEDNLDTLLSSTLHDLSHTWPSPSQSSLPSGICHNDLFDDNVFFLPNNTLSGVFDFYFASHELFIYDIAVSLHAWCFPDHKKLDTHLATALLKAYQSLRPLTPQEWELFPTIMTGAAIRFISTRLYDWFHTPPSPHYQHKNPKDYIHHLKWCLDTSFNWTQFQKQASPY